MRREMLADKVPPPPLGGIECFFSFFLPGVLVCGWTVWVGVWVERLLSLFFPGAFFLVIIFLTLLPISIPKPPPSHPLSCSGRATFLSGRLTSYLLPPSPFFLWCCCLYILWLLSNLCLLSLLLPPSFIVQLHFVFTPSTNSSSYSSYLIT